MTPLEAGALAGARVLLAIHVARQVRDEVKRLYGEALTAEHYQAICTGVNWYLERANVVPPPQMPPPLREPGDDEGEP